MMGDTEGSIKATSLTEYSKHDEMSSNSRGPLTSFIKHDGMSFGEMYTPSHMDQLEYKRGVYIGHPLGARRKDITNHVGHMAHHLGPGPMDNRHHSDGEMERRNARSVRIPELNKRHCCKIAKGIFIQTC